MWFGAVFDGVSDDTASIQKAIDIGNNDAEIIYPAGTALCSTIRTTQGIVHRGKGAGLTYLKQASGETDPLFTDKGNAANVWVFDMSFDGNGNNHDTSILRLGMDGIQMGTVGGIKNTFIRNSQSLAMQVNANVSYFDTIEIWDCKEGF